MADPLPDRRARGRTITDATTRRERIAKKQSFLWSVVRAAARVADESSLYSRGLYEIHPALMLRLRETIDRIRPDLNRMDEELTPVDEQQDDAG